MDSDVFRVVADFEPMGDQPVAIESLLEGLVEGKGCQVLEGVTGSGKTFTVANVIARYGRPTLVLSHNKTLAAQLYAELKAFFPDAAVTYFVSYFDYYQPEAYIARTDTFIEKDSSINEEIERMRLASTDSMLNRDDVIVVASVSCIYGLGSPDDYLGMTVHLEVGAEVERDVLLKQLVAMQYTRNEVEKVPGTFRVLGDTVEVYPAYAEHGYRVSFFGDELEALDRVDTLTGSVEEGFERLIISPARHFVTPYEKIKAVLPRIRAEMEERVAFFEGSGKLLEAQRIRMRTEYDLEMLQEVGFCSGIENYSRHLTGREEGARPYTMLDFFRGDFLTILDESHATVPQLNGMYNGDRSRKEVLVEHGFRLPSALDNRPLRFEEFMGVVGPMICVSATPGAYELQVGGEVVRQLIRPTGILDPEIVIRPLKGQIDDLIEEVRVRAERKERILVTTLTKRTAEDLTEYLSAIDLRVKYLHSEVKTLDRIEILRALRMHEFDCLVGINLLREGLDMPEVTLVAILDADKEGFLRSKTSLIQTAGRAARNVDGVVILYADTVTDSIQALLDVTEERRAHQRAYNVAHGVTPRTIMKGVDEGVWVRRKSAEEKGGRSRVAEGGASLSVDELIEELEGEMKVAAKGLEFERAAMLRDQIMELKVTLGGGMTGKKKVRYGR